MADDRESASLGRLHEPLPGSAPLIDRVQPGVVGTPAPVALASPTPNRLFHARIAQFTPAT